MKLEGHNPTIWGYATFAPSWFADAGKEAATEPSRDSTRREIVFAVCFLESYIFEWVRSIDLNLAAEHFPPKPRFEKDPRYRRTLKDKWKKVPKELFEDGHLAKAPVLDLSEAGVLFGYRHGLVHAAASRPFNSCSPSSHKPSPDPNKFNDIESGWAIGVAAKLVTELHESTGTECPDYVLDWMRG